MLKRTTALATLLTLTATPYMALADDASLLIKDLPKKGTVSLSGIVTELDGDKEFTLRDAQNDTIEIEAKSKTNVREGDLVSVIGGVDTGMLGLDKEIDADTVTINRKASNIIHAEKEPSLGKTANAVADSVSKTTSEAVNATGAALGSAGSAIADTAKKGADAVTDAAKTTKDAVSSRVNKMADPSKEWHGGEYGSIDKLPDSGNVAISGEVTSVSSDSKRFVIKDETDETIDIHTTQPLNIREGDKVKVKGEMRDEIAGIGQEILAFDVSVTRQ